MQTFSSTTSSGPGVAGPSNLLPPSKSYVYVLVRTDISVEQQLVQVGHAALEAGFRFNAPRETASLIVLAVPDRPALEEASARLSAKGIEHELFHEPDFGMGHSALATRPLAQKSERNLMRRYPLYRAEMALAGRA